MGVRYFHVIRHGKTEANIKRFYCGATDLPLSEEGIEEIAGYKRAGLYPVGHMFYTSTLKRTEQTLCEIFGAVEAIRLPAISEFNFGAFEMKSYDDLKSDSRYIHWIEDRTELVDCPGGECFYSFRQRIGNGFIYIIEQTPADISDTVVVTHGGVIACIMERYFGSHKHFYEWLPACGLGYSLAVYDHEVTAYRPIGA